MQFDHLTIDERSQTTAEMHAECMARFSQAKKLVCFSNALKLKAGRRQAA